MDQRHRQPRLRLSDGAEGQRLHLVGQQPREPAHAVVERSRRAIVRAKRSICATTTPATCGARRRCRFATRPAPMSRATAADTAASNMPRTRSPPICCNSCRSTTRSRFRASCSQSVEPASPSQRDRLCGVGARPFASAHRCRSSSTEIDAATGAMFARNPWNMGFGSRVAFVDLRGAQTDWTGDRREFIGRNGTLADPAALAGGARCRTRSAPASIPARRLRTQRRAAAGRHASRSSSSSAKRKAPTRRETLIARYRAADLDAVWPRSTAIGTRSSARSSGEDARPGDGHHAQRLAALSDAGLPRLGALGLLSGERRLWLPRPAAGRHGAGRDAARHDARASAARGGAAVRRGRRAALVAAAFRPGRAHAHLRRSRLARLTPSPTMSRRPATSPFSTRAVPFLEGQSLEPGEHDSFFSRRSPTRRRPCSNIAPARSTQSLARGAHRLAADRHRRLERRHEPRRRKGAGESVWLGWFLHAALTAFAPLRRGTRRDDAASRSWRAHAAALQASLEREAWDGDWYRRAFFDDGTPLGSAASEECRIDSIAQSWAVLSGAAPARAGGAARWPRSSGS